MNPAPAPDFTIQSLILNADPVVQGVMALLLWANLTGIALFVGVAFTAQLEARRVGISGPAVADQERPLEERSETTLISRA